MVVQACLSGVVKQSGSGPPSRQIFDSISIRTVSPKPRGLVAWSEKYLDGNIMSRVQINGYQLVIARSRTPAPLFWIKCGTMRKTSWELQVPPWQMILDLHLSNTFTWLKKSLPDGGAGNPWVNLLVIENHGIILSLQAVILPLFSSELVLEVVCCQPELQYIHRLFLFNILQRKRPLWHLSFKFVSTDEGFYVQGWVCHSRIPAVTVWSNGPDSLQSNEESKGNISWCNVKNFNSVTTKRFSLDRTQVTWCFRPPVGPLTSEK